MACFHLLLSHLEYCINSSTHITTCIPFAAFKHSGGYLTFSRTPLLFIVPSLEYLWDCYDNFPTKDGRIFFLFFFLQWHVLEKSEDFMSSFICTLTQATRNNVRMDEVMGWGLPCSWIKIVFKLHMRPHIVNTKQEGYTNICRATRSIKVL